MQNESTVPFDTGKPSPARMYDYFLGGKDNFEADRAAGVHFLPDADDPARTLSAFRDRLCPGSYLALSHLTDDGMPTDELDRVEAVYAQATSPIVFRPPERIREFFDGFEIQEPGLVRPWRWRPELGADGPRTEALYAGLGRLPAD